MHHGTFSITSLPFREEMTYFEILCNINLANSAVINLNEKAYENINAVINLALINLI